MRSNYQLLSFAMFWFFCVNSIAQESDLTACSSAGVISQPPASGFNYLSQEDADSPNANSYVADDFTTPDSPDCENVFLTEIRVTFTNQNNDLWLTCNGGGPVDLVFVIYNDSVGTPGATTVWTETLLLNDRADVSLENFEGIYLLNDCPELDSGTTYWLSVYAIANTGDCGREFLELTEITSGNLVHWQNPGDGFGSGCTTWTEVDQCGFASGPRDFVMDLTFCCDPICCHASNGTVSFKN